MVDDVRLTEGERRELSYMAAGGPQHTFGKGRARVQNSLKRKGLAHFVDIDDEGCGGERCYITPAGRRALAAENGGPADGR